MKVSDVRELAGELRPHVEAALDSAEILKGLASVARDKGVDWGELKKLVKAQALDARDGTDKRVAAIIEKADFAAAYADMLGFATKMNDFSESCSSENAATLTQPPAQQPSAVPASSTEKLRQDLQASIAMADAGPCPDFLLRNPVSA